jgi:hypothetical protein
MYLGKEYETIFKLTNKKTRMNGLTFDDMRIICEKFGVKLYAILDKIHKKDKPAMIMVKSKNYKGWFHTVYWDGKKLYDPSVGKRYIKLPKKMWASYQEAKLFNDDGKN